MDEKTKVTRRTAVGVMMGATGAALAATQSLRQAARICDV